MAPHFDTLETRTPEAREKARMKAMALAMVSPG